MERNTELEEAARRSRRERQRSVERKGKNIVEE